MTTSYTRGNGFQFLRLCNKHTLERISRAFSHMSISFFAIHFLSAIRICNVFLNYYNTILSEVC